MECCNGMYTCNATYACNGTFMRICMHTGVLVMENMSVCIWNMCVCIGICVCDGIHVCHGIFVCRLRHYSWAGHSSSSSSHRPALKLPGRAAKRGGGCRCPRGGCSCSARAAVVSTTPRRGGGGGEGSWGLRARGVLEGVMVARVLELRQGFTDVSGFHSCARVSGLCQGFTVVLGF